MAATVLLSVTESYNFIDRLDSSMTIEAQAVVSKTVFDIEAQAKRNASGRPGPNVITGTLRNSIRGIIDPGGLTGRVVVGAYYGAYVELGPHGKPYFYPAIETVKPAYIEACQRIAAKAMAGGTV